MEGYREITEAGPRLWRIPLRQPRTQRTAGYSFAARAIASADIERALQTLPHEVAKASNVYDLPSIEQAVH